MPEEKYPQFRISSGTEAQEFVETLMRWSTDGMLITDSEHNIIMVNDAFCSYLGRQWQELVNTKIFIWLEEFGFSAVQIWIELEKRVYSEGVVLNEEFEMKYPEYIEGEQEVLIKNLSVNASLLAASGVDNNGIIISSWRDITDRKRMEYRAQETKDELDSIFHSTGDAIRIIDRNYNIIRVNNSFLKLVGLPEEEVIYSKCYDHLCCDNCHTKQCSLTRIMEGSGYFKCKSTMTTSKGKEIPVEAIVTPLKKGNRIVGIIEAIRDVSERLDAEKLVMENEQKFRGIFNHTFQFIGLLDLSGKIIEINQPALDFIGIKEEEVVGKYFWDTPWWLHSRDLQERLQEAVKSAADGNFIRFEVSHVGLDGSIRCVDFSIKPLKDEKGNIVLLVPEGHDITERKEAEEKLQESENTFRTLVSNIPGVVYRCLNDSERTMTFISNVIEEVSGYASSDFFKNIVRSYSSIIYPDDYKYVEQKILAGIMNKRPYFVEYRIVHANGRPKWVYEKGQGIFNRDGKLLYLDGAIFDVNERKIMDEKLRKARNELEKSNRELEQFAYVASHDLQEPLRKVIAFGDLFRESYDKDLKEESLKHLTVIQNAAYRMSFLLDGLYEYAKITTHGKTFKEVDLAKTIDDVLETLQLRIKECSASVEVGDMPIINADKIQMELLFQNLITNALKFQEEGVQPIVIIKSSKLTKGTIEITIQDNGIGFDEAYMKRMFAPFQRLHSKSKFSGLGMGLPICEKIVKRHGGSIIAKSVKGEGSTFYIQLPIETNKERGLHE